MKSSRLLLFMQIMSILPAIFFLFIYADTNIYSLLAVAILLLLVGINIYKYIKKIRLVRYPIVLALVGTFFLYAFYGLGSTQTPQSFENLKAKETATLFSFGKLKQIDKICYYVGIDKNANFTLDYMQKDGWKNFYTYKKNFPYSFRWSCIKSNLLTSKVMLRITKNQMMFGEVRFSHLGKTIPYKTNRKLLNDEPEPSVDTSYYSGMFFDEIYHGRTAYEIRHGMSIYENTHPYLGKLLIIPGIEMFDMTPFGWRFTNVLFAGLLIFMAYYFALQLFRKRLLAFTAAFLMTYSFMHLTQSRMAHIDTFGVLFVFISYFFLYRFIIKQHLYLLLYSGVFFGLASAVKWSAVFASIGFVFIALYLLISKYPLHKRFAGVKLLLYGILSYGVVAVIVYALSFFDIYFRTGSLQSVMDYNFNMYNYHSTMAATHSYSSQWWSWPLDIKPMCYYRQIHGQLFSSITVFGNPAIFWVGIVAVLYLFYVMIKRATLEASFILLSFLGLYLPYIFVGRLMFIYHFYYAVPFVMLAIVYGLKDIVKYFPTYRKYYGVYLLIVAALFLAFYPVLSGYEVPKTYVDQQLKWFSGWWL